MYNATVVCRPAAGVCDQPELCDGSAKTCPVDVLYTNTRVCRNTTGICDITEYCTGTDATCPADFFVSSGTVCRAAVDLCDVSETCTGSDGACPVDAYQVNGYLCRGSAGDCDLAETCDGVSTACPSDAFVANGVECRAASDTCDLAEQCTGLSAACPADVLQPNGYLCRPLAGACDAQEFCTGVNAACPPDLFATTSTVCRGAGGTCDPQDVCSGFSVDCPPNVIYNSSVVCRPAVGVCDAPETCNGVDPGCPIDVFLSSATICRPAVGPCDINETCTGSSTTCPPDSIRPGGYICNVATSSCTANASCTGLSTTCPSTAKPPGSSCSVDGNLCFLDQCAANGTCLRGLAINYDDGLYCNGMETCNTTTGLVIPGTPPVCNDGTSCTIDTCSNILSACVFTPFPGSTGPCGGGFGACTPGNLSCDGSGPTPVITCVGEVLPVAEICFDGIDNDCDNVVDEFCIGQPCLSNDDCFNISIGTCESVNCTAGSCLVTPKAAGSQCDDNRGCTQIDLCTAFGTCEGQPVVCNDFIECTYDFCAEPYGRCVFDGAVLEGATCLSGECNGQGTCTPIPNPCPALDESSCVRYVFNRRTGQCEEVQVTGACNDGDECTLFDACIGGVCVGQPKTCDDFIECTVDSCLAPTGTCQHQVEVGTCRIDGRCWADGQVNSQCSCTMCNSSLSTIAWSPILTDDPCDDGDSCTENDACVPGEGFCAGTPISCPSAPQCANGMCINGACEFVPMDYGDGCDDDDACTEYDICTPGGCRGEPLNCVNSSSECMVGVCDPFNGCVAVPVENYTRCNVNADACAGLYYCLDGVCVSEGPVVCPVSTNPCVEIVCNPEQGCAELPLYGLSCDDDNACTIGDVCNLQGVCTPGAIWLDCDDQNDCTDDFCAPSGGCTHVPISNCQQCNATADCSQQTCQQVHCVRGACRYIAVPVGFSCADNDVCNGHEVCTGNGVCVSLGPLVCDDQNSCTDDTCNPTSGCAFTPNVLNSCSDNDPCTVNDACAANGTCVGYPFPCPTDTTCTEYVCENANGDPLCVGTPINRGSACSSGDSCLHSGMCDEHGVCVEESVHCPQPQECVDSYSCVDGVCTPAYSAPGTQCNLDNLCKTSECDGSGTCLAVADIITCSIAPQCQVASICIERTGECEPIFADDGTDCDDDDSCTAVSHCTGGRCHGFEPNLCINPDSCHKQGICDPLTGDCNYPELANFTPCIPTNVPVNESMTSYVCISGECIGTDPVYCPALENECLIPQRDSELGCIYTFPEDQFCDDDDLCTFSEMCSDGACVGGTTRNCSYDTLCGVSYCLSNIGCINTVSDCKVCTQDNDCPYIPCKQGYCDGGVCAYRGDDTALSGCDDSQFCNGDEYCFAGSCHTRPPPDCDDFNMCTIDTCDYDLQQCRHTPTGNITCQNNDLCASLARCDGKGHCLTVHSLTCGPSTPCRHSLGCNPKTGACLYDFVEDGRECNEPDNLCATKAVCNQGVCNVIENVTCDRGCECDSADTCDMMVGRCVEPTICNYDKCTDRDLCTLGDQCVQEVCTPGQFSPCDFVPHDEQCQLVLCMNGNCLVDNAEDGTPCLIDIPYGPCTDEDVCVGGTCTRRYKEATVCREASPGGCDVPEYCGGSSDYCPTNSFAPDDTACPNTLFCYDNTCKSGRCLPQTTRDCSALDSQCTTGVCDEAAHACVAANKVENTPCVSGKEGQCVPFSSCKLGVCVEYYANELTLCDDGSLCSVDDHCSGYNANCVAGSVLSCAHLDTACSLGACNPLSGECVATTLNEGLPCDADGNPCTTNDTCVGGVCTAGPAYDCSYLNSSCQYGACIPMSTTSASCTTVVTDRACDPDFCTGGCTVPFQWWSLHNSGCKDQSLQFTWPDNLEQAIMCDQTYYYWSQKRARTVWIALMHEWMTAVLNNAKGACLPATVTEIIGDAETLLEQCNFDLATNDNAARLYKSYAIVFKTYNSGMIGAGECAQAPCATPLFDTNYFDCLFQTRDVVPSTTVDFFSADTCEHGLWDYVSDTCNCFVGWAGLDCNECAPSVNENEVFVCVPAMASRDFLLRSIATEDISGYTSDDPEELLEIVRMTGRRARFPGDGKLDCACQRLDESEDLGFEARDLSVFIAQDNTLAYIGAIEENLQLCEQVFDVTIVHANPDCVNTSSLTVVLPGNETNCEPPVDWRYICDCCSESDDDCACPHNDIMCLRNHVIQSHQRLKNYQLLFIVLTAVAGGLILWLSIYVLRSVFSSPATKKTKARESGQSSRPIAWSLNRQRKHVK